MSEDFDITGMYKKERERRPLEAAVRKFAHELRAYMDMRNALMDDTVSRNLDPESTLAVRVERKIAELEQKIDSRAEALATERREYAAEMRKIDRWDSPSSPEGWLCHLSPTGVCKYENGDWDCCDYCGDPEERK